MTRHRTDYLAARESSLSGRGKHTSWLPYGWADGWGVMGGPWGAEAQRQRRALCAIPLLQGTTCRFADMPEAENVKLMLSWLLRSVDGVGGVCCFGLIGNGIMMSRFIRNFGTSKTVVSKFPQFLT